MEQQKYAYINKRYITINLDNEDIELIITKIMYNPIKSLGIDRSVKSPYTK